MMGVFRRKVWIWWNGYLEKREQERLFNGEEAKREIERQRKIIRQWMKKI